MFAVWMRIVLLFARSSSLSRPVSLDLRFFTTPSENRLFTGSSFLRGIDPATESGMDQSRVQAGMDVEFDFIVLNIVLTMCRPLCVKADGERSNAYALFKLSA